MNDCPICVLVKETENPRYRDRKVVVFDPCPLCPDPVLIIRQHLAEPTAPAEGERGALVEIMRELFGDNARFVTEPQHGWRHFHCHIKR